jgi:hypothetical protein
VLCILLFPLLGSVFYFLYEVAPGSREQRRVLKFGSDIVKAIQPDKELQRRAAEMEVCGSIANRVSFAAECTERGMFDEAIRIYRGAREGQYQNAPDLLLGLARAYYFNNQPTEARATLGELRNHHPDYYRQEVAILSARAAEASGDRVAALAELEGLLSHSVGLEARYRYAEILGATDRRAAPRLSSNASSTMPSASRSTTPSVNGPTCRAGRSPPSVDGVGTWISDRNALHKRPR